jgi:23S rRNA (adenine2503-C2)-methyltransferase
VNPQTLLGLPRAGLERVLTGLGQPAFRGRQVADWLYRHGARTFGEMTNLPRALRERLAADFAVGRARIVTTQQASNGTVKFLLEETDGERIECVLLPEHGRTTACISSQAGCAVGCTFCATGLMGGRRNLTAGEIVDQVLTVRERLTAPTDRSDPTDPTGLSDPPVPPPPSLTHIVFMGMGEPLLNYENVLAAVHLLHEEVGFSRRHITLSTVGIVPKIRQLAREKLPLTLAISLQSPDDDLRGRLIPTSARRWKLRELLEAAQEYTQETGRRVTFEYVVLDGVNDRPEQAVQLGRLLRGQHCHVNLIPFNPVPGAPFHRPSRNRVRIFRQLLEEQGVKVTQRFERGADIAAACGQLKTEKEREWSRLALD